MKHEVVIDIEKSFVVEVEAETQAEARETAKKFLSDEVIEALDKQEKVQQWSIANI